MLMSDAVELLVLMGVDYDSIIEDADRDWVRCKCPLASATHANGQDSHPSFGIHIREDNFSQYKCFTCGRGTVSDLVHRYNFLIDNYNPKVSSHYIESQYKNAEKQVTYKDKYTKEERNAKDSIKEIPEELLDQFPLIYGSIGGVALRAKEYLLNRGVSLDVAYEYQVRFDRHSNLVFPFIDLDNKIYGLHIRSITDKVFWHFSNNAIRYNKPDCWFGMSKWNFKEPTLLVEGQFDLLRVKTIAPELNVIASCGTPSFAKLNRLSVCREIICGYDADDAGRKYVTTTRNQLVNSNALTKVYSVDWSICKIKDAGALFDKSQLLQCLREKVLCDPKVARHEYVDKYKK